MLNVKLSHKQVGDRLLVSKSWVTNGHWAIQKIQLAHAEHYATPETTRAALRLSERECSEIHDDRMAAVMAGQFPTACVEFERTPIVLRGEGNKYMRIFRNHCAAKAIDEDLVQWLDLRTVKGTTDPKQAVLAHDDTVLVMPLRGYGHLINDTIRAVRMICRADRKNVVAD